MSQIEHLIDHYPTGTVQVTVRLEFTINIPSYEAKYINQNNLDAFPLTEVLHYTNPKLSALLSVVSVLSEKWKVSAFKAGSWVQEDL